MTNKNALLAVVQVAVEDDVIEKALLDQSLNLGSTYTTTNAKAIDLAAIDVLDGILSRPDISEGGFSVRYDRTAIQKRLDALKRKQGITSGPVIRDASNRW